LCSSVGYNHSHRASVKKGGNMKAYKVFNNDWTCKGFQYEVGKTYKIDGEIDLCSRGFHACKKLEDCFSYYASVQWNKIAEVKLSGTILGKKSDKQCAAEITIVKEIDFNDIGTIISGTADSWGTANSRGTAYSWGCYECEGISRSIFCNNTTGKLLFFNKKITEERWGKINSEFRTIISEWYPQFNNLKALYLKSGSVWEKTPIPNSMSLSKKEAWHDMPIEAIDYLKKQKEFDAKIFEEITGITFIKE